MIFAEYLKSPRVENWKEAVQDRDRWRNVVMAAKALGE